MGPRRHARHVNRIGSTAAGGMPACPALCVHVPPVQGIAVVAEWPPTRPASRAGAQLICGTHMLVKHETLSMFRNTRLFLLSRADHLGIAGQARQLGPPPRQDTAGSSTQTPRRGLPRRDSEGINTSSTQTGLRPQGAGTVVPRGGTSFPGSRLATSTGSQRIRASGKLLRVY